MIRGKEGEEERVRYFIDVYIYLYSIDKVCVNNASLLTQEVHDKYLAQGYKVDVNDDEYIE